MSGRRKGGYAHMWETSGIPDQQGQSCFNAIMTTVHNWVKSSADAESWGRPAEVSRQEELELTDFLGKWKRACSRR